MNKEKFCVKLGHEEYKRHMVGNSNDKLNVQKIQNRIDLRLDFPNTKMAVFYFGSKIFFFIQGAISILRNQGGGGSGRKIFLYYGSIAWAFLEIKHRENLQ